MYLTMIMNLNSVTDSPLDSLETKAFSTKKAAITHLKQQLIEYGHLDPEKQLRRSQNKNGYYVKNDEDALSFYGEMRKLDVTKNARKKEE